MLGISGGDPAFRGDDGSAHPEVAAALTEFAAARGSERAVLLALAGSRLLAPVVAVLADEAGSAEDAGAVSGFSEASPNGRETPTATASALRAAGRGEKASDMAMPTLIGLDGRRAVPAFTSLQSMSRWQSDARPVPVAASAIWQTACADSAAVVIDVAGPVPFAIEGARLAALARGGEPPEPHEDPDVHEIIAAVLANQLQVASFDLEPGEDGQDLAIVLTLTDQARASLDHQPGLEEKEDGVQAAARIGSEVAEAVQARLGGRFRRGIAIWLSDS